jgi:hypothetical protein
MRSRAINSTNDWTFGSGFSNYVYNNAAIAQNINTRLASFLGNCFFDLGAGINWFFFLGSIGQELALNLAISTTILQTPGVTALAQLSNTLIDRNFTVNYSVLTIYSSVTSNFVFSTQIG